jgi:thioredoxin-like negative regulator of GroEL
MADFKKIIAEDKLTLVKFWAPWCHFCKSNEPHFQRALKVLGDKVVGVKVNCDEEEAVADEQHVESLPAFVLYLKGKELGRVDGAQSAKAIVEFVAANTPKEA